MRNLTDADRKRWLVRCGDRTVEQLQWAGLAQMVVSRCASPIEPTHGIGSFGCGFTGVGPSRRASKRPLGGLCSRREATGAWTASVNKRRSPEPFAEKELRNLNSFGV